MRAHDSLLQTFHVPKQDAQGLLAIAFLQARGFGQLGKGLVLDKTGMAIVNDAEL